MSEHASQSNAHSADKHRASEPTQTTQDEFVPAEITPTAQFRNPSVSRVVALQRQIGNRAVQQVLKSNSKPVSAPPTVSRAPQMIIQRDINTLDELSTAKPVTKFLQSAQKQMLEEHLKAPKLTGNARDALKLADKLAKERRAEDKAAVEDRMVKVGVDLAQYPNAYDEAADYLRSKHLTVNFGTHLLELIFKNKDFLNMWNLPLQTTDANYAAGRDLTERTLHGLPALDPASGKGTHRKDKQKFNEELLSKPEGLGHKNHKAKDELARQGKSIQDVIPPKTQEERSTAFTEWFRENRECTLEEFEQACTRFFGVTWMDWYYSSRGGKVGETMDRPISSGLNVSDYRGGAAPQYGTTHIELRDSVKERTTVTGQDSKDFIYEKGLGAEAVGTFQELGPVMRYMEDAAFKRLVDLAVFKKKPSDVKGEAGYIEVQIFGGIDLTRDVSKIVIDQDDLDLWAAGKLLIDPMLGEGVRPAKDTSKLKEMIIAFGKKHNIPVEFIRSGKDKNRKGHVSIKNKAEDRLAVRKPWESQVETALNTFKSKQWMQGIAKATELGIGGRKPSSEPSPSATGLSNYNTVVQEIKKLWQKGDKVSTVPNLPTVVSELAARLLTTYYQSPVKEQHMGVKERMSKNAVYWLGQITVKGIKNWG